MEYRRTGSRAAISFAVSDGRGYQTVMDGEYESDKTALLPKSFFGDKDLEPGKTCKVEVVHIYEDEVEVKYVGEKGEKSEPSEVDAKIDLMAQL